MLSGVRIGIALFDGAEELDFAGPWEVLAAWATQWPDDGVEVFTVADSLEPVTCAKGMRVVPDATWETRREDRRARLPGRDGHPAADRRREPSAAGCAGSPATGR